jgi:hypothetical protein
LGAAAGWGSATGAEPTVFAMIGGVGVLAGVLVVAIVGEGGRSIESVGRPIR